ncbi:divergent polysaccharide deacetylase family protein [Paenibacillus cisolokensis]|uniref:divergent polysaccharide deacetylase family protein n=1 Tax=Paenibacillus cisolokensis TaxID=1658519 RepID=UPI003D26D204
MIRSRYVKTGLMFCAALLSAGCLDEAEAGAWAGRLSARSEVPVFGLSTGLHVAKDPQRMPATESRGRRTPPVKAGERYPDAEDRNAGVPQSKNRKLAIIIDDFGNGQKGTAEMLNLPVKITVAVMPFLATSREDAEKAHQQGHDVIIHMPMEPKQGQASWLGPGAITTSLTDEEIRQRLEAAIDSIPHAIGINNHMGSKVTGDERVMSIVLDVCKERGLFFIDSKTNYHSIALKLAQTKGVPALANDLFLDDVHTVPHVQKQLKTAAELAIRKDTCIAIGHVGKFGGRTAEALKLSVEQMKGQVEFVGIGELAMERSSWRPGTVPIF